ncbi:hypothetical protein PMIN03_012684 [Paraphaeosphaeria minitans]
MRVLPPVRNRCAGLPHNWKHALWFLLRGMCIRSRQQFQAFLISSASPAIDGIRKNPTEMATLDHLKQTLRCQTKGIMFSGQKPLSEEQYSSGFGILVEGSKMSYQDFIIPQLSQLLRPLVDSQSSVSVLEIGPGPSSIFGRLPDRLRRKIGRYAAFEPNALFVKTLTESLCSPSPAEPVLPSLEQPAVIHQRPFDIPDSTKRDTCIDTENAKDTYDIILFCHSMYGMKSKRRVVKHALRLVKNRPQKGLVIVFHRSGSLHFESLVCHKTATFSTGVIHVVDNDEVLDCFASFIAGFTVEDTETGNPTPADWRQVCRTLCRRDDVYSNHLLFSAPETMTVFTQEATSLPELTTQVPLADSGTTIKDWMARSYRPASIVKPKSIQQVQQCVRWALKHNFSFTVIGGGHSDHCVWPAVVSIDMGAFDQIPIFAMGEERGHGSDAGSIVVVEAGCKAGDIVREAMVAGVTVPLGARPSVGAGLWLQGGIGHLARQYGLACDAIVGAVMVSVTSGQILYVGHVPNQYRPVDATPPECERDLLWALKGAGTNFGIVISVTLKTYPAPTYRIRNWTVPLGGSDETRLRIGDFDDLTAKKLQRLFRGWVSVP